MTDSIPAQTPDLEREARWLRECALRMAVEMHGHSAVTPIDGVDAVMVVAARFEAYLLNGTLRLPTAPKRDALAEQEAAVKVTAARWHEPMPHESDTVSESGKVYPWQYDLAHAVATERRRCVDLIREHAEKDEFGRMVRINTPNDLVGAIERGVFVFAGGPARTLELKPEDRHFEPGDLIEFTTGSLRSDGGFNGA